MIYPCIPKPSPFMTDIFPDQLTTDKIVEHQQAD